MDMISAVVLAGEDPHLLSQTLDSLQGQNYPCVEVIVVERGENPLLPNHPWGQVVTMPPDSTTGACLHTGAMQARGDYITFVEAGTVLTPTWLYVAVRTLQLDPSLGWCYTCAGIADTSDILPPKNWEKFQREGRIFPELITRWGISWQSVVMTQVQYHRLGGFDQDLTALAGEELLLRLSLDTPAKDTGTQMIQVQPSDHTSPQALVERCYWMSRLFQPLERMGLVEQVIRSLLEDIDDAGAWDVTGEYLNILGENPQYQQAMDRFFQREIPQREMIMAQTPDISGVVGCVGCGGCQSICPVHAISMEPNEEGFLYPVVDQMMCIQCNLCLAVCPTQEELPAVPAPHIYYGLQGPDDVRMKASSGGVFPLLAQHILEQGGYVAGAVYDRNFKVHHVVSNRKEDIAAMRTSKYVQSDTSQVYSVIKGLLEAGKLVLFTGTACQVAGLLAYLSDPYENLYTMDVTCHGVPSPGVFARYLDQFRRKKDPITQVNFRNKKVFGWATNLYIQYASGQSYAPTRQDPYMVAFLHDWILRESCYHCQFKGMRYSDLTAADFWGIQYLDPTFEDGKGTSFLTINTPKGQQLFQILQGKFKKSAEFGRESEPILEIANPNLRSSVRRPKFRDVFFRFWQETPGTLEQVWQKAFASLHFDVGLILHWSPNFGNALTNYALYTHLAKSRQVLAVDNCGTLHPTGPFAQFADRHYVCSSHYFPCGQIALVENSCDALVVGSDQVWNRYFNQQFQSGSYYQLGFAGDRVRKVAYGASFGTRGAEPLPQEFAPLYRRFDKIGVREAFGVESCRELYGVEAECVLDPVFLLEEADYQVLADQSHMEETHPFILAYILNPTEEKRRAIQQLQQQLGGDVKVISLCEPVQSSIELSRRELDFAYICSDPTVEDFLYLFQNCQYVVTDSFHGTCFSLIFRKNFMSFVNRQPDRFTVFQKFGDASRHIGTSPSQDFLETCLQPLDYDAIYRDLERERERSRKWLEDALG